ncbi:hypothetical protein MNBD_GAMMA13-1283 [hydrothermal vent metagenome]|uniref:Uncharacterized protein n=1 Tax=hydrothermal vent metagenome TaxID=652676 RepID=A0A3B0YJP2_9ZZZZ
MSVPDGLGETQSLAIRVTYKLEWQDGFGARGWKLDCTLDDPNVIATTAATGCQISTSVLVHDMLDHYISGFPLSGHRNEAMALIQLASRTGSDPRPDYAQMVDEDLMQGSVSGERLRSFLPPGFLKYLPDNSMSGKQVISALVDKLGQSALRTALIDRFFELGERGIPLAQASWRRHGLDYQLRNQFGQCLQKLLARVDKVIQERGCSYANGEFLLNNQSCQLHGVTPDVYRLKELVNRNHDSGSQQTL